MRVETMRKMTAIALVLAFLLVAIPAAPALAWYRGPVVYFGFGPAPWAPFWWPPYYYYPYPAPRIVIQQPPVYVQQAPPPPAPPAVSELPPPPAVYWYYCRSAGAYYPTVPQCPEPWVKVPPRPPQ
jgi:hypothetical protein